MPYLILEQSSPFTSTRRDILSRSLRVRAIATPHPSPPHRASNAGRSGAPQPQEIHPPRTPPGGARVHFPKPKDAIEVFVDGFPVTIPKGMTILLGLRDRRVDIPRFCYHSRLFITGNCRMCLVEVKKSPKPVASCAMPTLPGLGNLDDRFNSKWRSSYLIF
ncbi:hypothetical protein Syun_028279 [Stephania yunnanensis]|uniref:NADH dehydrogenase subunit 11 n=1 Tax=Stephania yunnanensis TaxID=152371 RepID=A0AAP0EPE4_9MAGN